VLISKREAVSNITQTAPVAIVVDPKQPGVTLPPQFQGATVARLTFSPRYGTPMELSDWGIMQVLHFNEGGNQLVALPWSSVVALWDANDNKSLVLYWGAPGWSVMFASPRPEEVKATQRSANTLVN
jgi:hypothetical protein